MLISPKYSPTPAHTASTNFCIYSLLFNKASSSGLDINPHSIKIDVHGYDDRLRIVEPLISPRLDPADWWKGVGNTGLLGNGEKIVALRVSRKVNTPSGIADVVDRMEKAVAKGYVILSGFISPGEKAVRDMLCRNSNAKFIRILPSSIPNRRFRPESQYIEPFAQGRYLEIAKGNDEVNFDRSACLDLNDEIVKIAKSGEGCALYVKG